MAKKIIIANWKANPTTFEDVEKIFRPTADASKKFDGVDLVICPPFIYLERLSEAIRAVPLTLKLGAQNTYWENSGPYTGEVSIGMLKALGANYVLVGHSERRAIGETDEQINKKIRALIVSGMTPVFLVGEEEKNDAIRQDIIVDQLTRGLRDIAPDDSKKIVYVYEPSWAISSKSGGHADDINDIKSGVSFIREVVHRLYKIKDSERALRVLYGGSVNQHNVEAILNIEGIDGAVVGGASLKPDEFKRILSTANNQLKI